MSAPVSPSLRSGSLPLLVALMTLLAGLALAGLSGVQTLARSWSSAGRSATTIEIPADTPDLTAQVQHLAQQLRLAPTVANVTVLTSDQVRTLLAPWLGPPSDAKRPSGLTLPTVMSVTRHEAAASGPDLETLVHGTIAGAVIEEDRRWGDRLEALGDSLVTCAWLAVALIAAIAVLSIGMTVRRSVVAQRRAVETVHFLGAGDLTISSRIAGRAGVLSLMGSIAGLALLAPVLALLAERLAPFTGYARGSTAGTNAWPLLHTIQTVLLSLPRPFLYDLGALPVLAAILAWLSAQTVALVWLRRLP